MLRDLGVNERVVMLQIGTEAFLFKGGPHCRPCISDDSNQQVDD